MIVPQITNNLPNLKADVRSLSIPRNINLADPQFHIPNKIDLLLGADYFWDVMCVGHIKLSRVGPILQKSKFGWIVSGAIQSSLTRNVQCNLSHIEIDKKLTRFWETEEISHYKPLSSEEAVCESLFVKSLTRNEVRRFVVTIPLKQTPAKLGNSYENAKKRLFSLERKFERNLEFKELYTEFINEYKDLGHMLKIDSHDDSEISYYMPHHGVIKETSTTTKLRTVFDASCCTDTGYSFNDLQMVGPTIQPDLLTTLLRFRKYNYVIAGDIEKMVLVQPNQRPLQRILWRENPNDPIDIYELTTVTYGTTSAAYLAIRCLYQLGIENSEASPRASDVIKNHFYVDDMLSGADTIDEVISVTNEVALILHEAGFYLRKWVSNSPEIISGITTNDQTNSFDLGSNENTKTLCVIWNGKSD